MTIDEAIAHARQVAKNQRKDYDNCKTKLEYGCKDCADYYSKPCKECAEEHEHLAEWLEELKRRREYDGEIIGSGTLNNAYNQGYNKAIDDFVKEICKMIVQSENNGNYRFYAVEIKQAIADLAEQLKAGEVDG